MATGVASWGGLQTYLSGLVKRTDLTAAQYTDWQTIVRARMDKDVNLPEMLLNYSIPSPVTNPFPVWDQGGGSFAKNMNIVSVWLTAATSGTGKQETLYSCTSEQAREISKGTGRPTHYVNYGDRIAVYPATGGLTGYTFEAMVKKKDRLMFENQNTCDYLELVPHIVIDAYLVEIYKYLRDEQGMMTADARYKENTDNVNRSSDWRTSGGTPTASGAWSWH